MNMKKTRWLLLFSLPILLFQPSCQTAKTARNDVYKPDDEALYETIAQLDSSFFGAYNRCETELETYGAFFSENIEFYHDQGGLMTSKKDIIEGTRQFVCGKVTRELVKGSLEVYSIKGFGAVEIGLHKFHNNQEPPDTPSHAGRFLIVWAQENGAWKIRRVVSLH